MRQELSLPNPIGPARQLNLRPTPSLPLPHQNQAWCPLFIPFSPLRLDPLMQIIFLFHIQIDPHTFLKRLFQ